MVWNSSFKDFFSTISSFHTISRLLFRSVYNAIIQSSLTRDINEPKAKARYKNVLHGKCVMPVGILLQMPNHSESFTCLCDFSLLTERICCRL